MNREKAAKMRFSDVYPLYVQKAERKGRTKAEVEEIIFWLTGYNQKSLNDILATDMTLDEFFEQCPSFNPNALLVKGVICGYRVEEIEDVFLRKLRILDKLIDELSKGKSMDKILR